MKAPASEKRSEQRIAKLLARAGVASRREIERMIVEGRVALNGDVLDTPATLLTSLRGVTVDGQPVREPAPARLFRFHKPAGLLTTERDPAGRPTIYDRLPGDLPRLVPVGRLDLNTEGLLLLTTDGELKRQLELPSTGVTRIYRARTFGDVSQEQLEQLIHGITIEGVRYGSIDANLERRTGRNQWIEMKLTEGKNREVRRVLEHLGLEVSRLIRTAYGPFELEDLPRGAVDEVRRHDLVVFRAALRGGRAAPDEAALLEGPSEPSPSYAPRPRPTRPARAPRPAERPAPKARPARSPARSGRGDRAPDGAEQASPKPRPARQQAAGNRTDRAPRTAERPAPKSRRPDPRADRDALVDRPRGPGRGKDRGTAAAPAPAPDASNAKPARPKRGAGWAKPKPRASSRPTPRGGGGKPGPSRGRPGGGKR